MNRQNPLSVAALAVALLALVLSLSGGAGAAAKIGKNLVVTKSIKNGAVTGAKVEDGSLTAADLASGTIPVPASGKTLVFLADNIGFPLSPNAPNLFAAVGDSTPAVAPVALTVAALHVTTQLQAAGASLTFSLLSGATLGDPAATTVLTCTVVSGASTCVGSQTGVIPAGNSFWMLSINGPTGRSADNATLSYTMTVS